MHCSAAAVVHVCAHFCAFFVHVCAFFVHFLCRIWCVGALREVVVVVVLFADNLVLCCVGNWSTTPSRPSLLFCLLLE